MTSTWIRPRQIRLEASSACQLRCPLCPVHSEDAHHQIGIGFLRFAHFKKLLDDNPSLEEIELSNYGEIFLNPQLLQILEYAHERGVHLTAMEGVNLNTVSPEVLEGLVKYRVRSLRCSIDGCTNAAYQKYRVNGDLDKVLENVRRIDAYKEQYRSSLPRLIWQFVVFGHNEHEIEDARRLARELGMDFRLKLSWDPHFSPVRNPKAVRKELGAADREEYEQVIGRSYASGTCGLLWNQPQINWDGRVLGCCRNFWGEFGGNAFSDGLEAAVNSEGMRYARKMLLGLRPAASGIPCSTCSEYERMAATGAWLDRRKLKPSFTYRLARSAYHFLWPGSCEVSGTGQDGPAPPRPARLSAGTYPIATPLLLDGDATWTPHFLFKGHTKGLYTWSGHVSVLAKGTTPHPPHTHPYEEVLVLLTGAVDIVVPDAPGAGQDGRISLRPGQFVYYPRGFAHTLETTSPDAANYLMFDWTNPKANRRTDALRFDVFDTSAAAGSGEPQGGLATRVVFEGSTAYLRRLHCHVSTLSPGGGYEPHADPYDVAIVVLEGEVETLGRTVRPHGIIVYPSGTPHGIHNPGRTAARYVVFEFHGVPTGLWNTARFSARRSLGRARRKLRTILRG